MRQGWWWLDRDLNESNDVRGIGFKISDDMFLEVVAMGFATPDIEIPIEFCSFSWKIGTSLKTLVESLRPKRTLSQDEFNQASAIRLVVSRFLLAGFAWLGQLILSMNIGHVERHRRKQLAREAQAPMPSDVKVIQLRRSESQSRPPSAGGEVVDWSCRWIVGGHWRNQPYKDEHKLIYIMPFVKGPEDKPLRVPTHTVYSVSR